MKRKISTNIQQNIVLLTFAFLRSLSHVAFPIHRILFPAATKINISTENSIQFASFPFKLGLINTANETKGQESVTTNIAIVVLQMNISAASSFYS